MTIQLHPLWKNAVRAFLDAGFKHGDVIPHAWLMQEFGIERPISIEEAEKAQFKFLEAYIPFRDSLLEKHLIALAPCRGEGYRVLPPAEQTEYAVSTHMKRVHKEMRSMTKMLSFVDRGQLTDAEARANSDAIAKTAQLHAMMKSTRILPPGK